MAESLDTLFSPGAAKKTPSSEAVETPADKKDVKDEKSSPPVKKESSPDPKKEKADSKTDKKEEKPKKADPSKKADDEKADKSKKSDDKSEKPKNDDSEKPNKESEDGEEGDSDEKGDTDPWESDDNTYKKRYTDTRDALHRESNSRRQNELKMEQISKQLEIMQKKQDGTWTEADEKAMQPSSEQVASTALRAGKALASRESAYRQHGKEQVEGWLNDFHQLFGENDLIQQAVLGSDDPVSAALGVLNRHRFESKYGNSPESIYDSIKKEVIGAHSKELRKQILEEIRSGKKAKDETTDDLTPSRGSGESTEGKPTPKAKSLKKLFG